MNEKELLRHKTWMTSPELWPHFPCQPIKNKRRPDAQGFPDLACLYFDFTEFRIKFIHKNLWLITPDDYKTAELADIDKLLEEGWEVD